MLFEPVPDQVIKMLNSSLNPEIDAQSRTRMFERRQHLPLSSEQLWQIKSGMVRTLTWTEEGALITLGLWGVGDVVGKALSSSDPYLAECLTAVSATPLFRNTWYQATDALIRHARVSNELLEIIRYGNAEVSFLRLLAWLAIRFGHMDGQG